MKVETVFRELHEKSSVTFHSTAALASEVRVRENKLDKERRQEQLPALLRPRQLVPFAGVKSGDGMSITPWHALHTFARATALAGHGSSRALAQHWDCLRYVNALHDVAGRMRLTDSGESWRSHKRGMQARDLGTAFGLTAAQHVLRKRHPGYRFDVVDAELALDAVCQLQGAGKDIREQTKLRPNYFLVGRKPGAPFLLLGVDSRGSHGSLDAQYTQLAKAGPRVHAMFLGDSERSGRPLRSLLLTTSLLTGGDIDTRMLEVDGADELATPGKPGPDISGPADDDHIFPAIESGSDDAQQTSRPGFPLHKANWEWFSRILARTTAASLLTFAGDRAAAGRLLTQRQKKRLESADSHSAPGMRVDTDITLAGMDFVGTDHVFRLEHQRVEVFSALRRDQHQSLAHARLEEHENRLPALLKAWNRNKNAIAKQWNGVVHMDDSGALLAIRVQDKHNEELS